MLGTLFFDKQDRELLRMINETIDHGPSQDLEHKVFDANLHPHGILELTTTHEYRMAHAVINLLGNLEAGGAPDRLMALRILRDEVLHSARTPFRYNTGRVLIQIMKEPHHAPVFYFFRSKLLCDSPHDRLHCIRMLQIAFSFHVFM